MTANNSIAIAFIGFGEVGQTFARDLEATGMVRLAAYDLVFDGAGAGERRAKARLLGVEPAGSAAAAAASARVVISAVTAAAALDVARAARCYLQAGQLFVDVNSASPETKKRAAREVEAAGAHYVEAAVMAPVLKPGLAVPILAGGSAAEEAARLLNPLGMNLTPVSKEHGRASAMKLCRSIVIKGLEALMVDCAAASARWGVADVVYDSLRQCYPSIDWAALAADMGERVATHGVRRAAEMREAADMLAELGLDSSLARAVAAAQQRGARKTNQTNPERLAEAAPS